MCILSFLQILAGMEGWRGGGEYLKLQNTVYRMRRRTNKRKNTMLFQIIILDYMQWVIYRRSKKERPKPCNC